MENMSDEEKQVQWKICQMRIGTRRKDAAGKEPGLGARMLDL